MLKYYAKKNYLKEYNDEKYFKLLNLINKGFIVNIKQAVKFISGEKYNEKKYIDYLKNNSRFLKKKISKNETIVEFGSGFGQILVNLKKDKYFKHNKFFGIDFSNNGILCAKKFSREIVYKKYDLNKNFIKYDFFKFINENFVALFVYSLLLINDTNSFFSKLLRLKISKIILIEPIYEHLSLKQKKYLIENNYKKPILKVLKVLEKKKILKILYIKKNFNCYFNKLLPASFIECQIL